MEKTKIVAALMFAGLSLGVAQSASAGVQLADGAYNIMINTTPVKTTTSGTSYKIGTNGNWNSSFTFGNTPGATSGGMTDNSTMVLGNGTSIGGDGYAGKIGITVSGGAISLTSFRVDTIYNTAGGNFAQYCSPACTGAGSVSAAGLLNLTINNRMGQIDAPAMTDIWNQLGTNWVPFTTGTASNAKGSFNGAAVASLGDINADGKTDYSAIMVSGGQVQGWASFNGASYAEAWNVKIVSAPVPVPAAAWLLGSGLLGLVGVARRKAA